ncbi:MAG: BACON domain-containing carbohydrate-binding protein [Blastocatellia bacterium]|nr:BACON domain-containing carbohydrate-binding protein [Blastocatellia bacterium]
MMRLPHRYTLSFRSRRRPGRRPLHLLEALLLVAGLSGFAFGWRTLANYAAAKSAEQELRASGRLGKGAAEAVWQEVGEAGGSRARAGGRRFRLNREALGRVLAGAPMESEGSHGRSGTILTLPMPDGTYPRFRLEESPILSPEQAAQYPEIRSYRGQGIDDPASSMRCDWTPQGFHALVLSPAQAVNILPEGDGSYGSFYHDAAATFASAQCLVAGGPQAKTAKAARATPEALQNVPVGPVQRTYRIAIAATAEYCEGYGSGENAGTLASIVTWLNGVNAIYERELSVRLMLVSGANVLYSEENGYTTSSDPFTDNNAGALVDQARLVLNTVVGVGNYDVGHVLAVQASGGQAYVGAVCNNADNGQILNGPIKGGGATAMTGAPGNSIAIAALAHELGHQFGANHSFNGTAGSCAGSARNGATAYEPGSGTTLMSMANLCGSDNVAGRRDLRFHAGSYAQIVDYLITQNNGACASPALTGNTAPTISAGADHTIPKNTPFTLTASGGDIDAGDASALTYAWDQMDAGAASYANPPYNDSGDGGSTTRPIFRSFPASASPARTFPSLKYILQNANDPSDTVGAGQAIYQTAEELPRVGRQLNFRATVRDNRGGVNDDAVVLTVADGAGPFQVLAPNTAVSWTGGQAQTISWAVNGTNAAPVNAANVRITLSTDGGQTFPITLAASTPNDGSESVTPPNGVITTRARIRIEAVGNIFFDISDANFSLAPGDGCTAIGLLDPAVGDVGSSVVIQGVNFTGATAVEFGGNVAASFTVDSDTRITATVPAGALAGPITIRKPGCGDVQSAPFTICSTPAATVQLDDNTFEAFGASPANTMTWFVNRIAPTGYPATLSRISIRFPSLLGLAPGTEITLVAGTNADGDSVIDGTGFQMITAVVGTADEFTLYPVNPITINSGDFLVGFAAGPSPHAMAVAADLTTGRNRSYLSTDGFTFELTPAMNYAIRAQIHTGQCGGSCPNLTIAPASLPNGTTGVAYPATVLAASGGSGLYSYSLLSGALPNGMALAPDGTISGAPTAPTVAQFAVRATDTNTGCTVGQFFTITVLDPCTYTLTPSSIYLPAAGGSEQFAVATLPAMGCPFTATTTDPWIAITNAASSPVTFDFLPNPQTVSRTGSISVAGKTFNITQGGTPCQYGLSPGSASFASGGGSGSFAVTTMPAAGCDIAASTSDSWITITNAASSPVAYTVAANNNATPRTGSILVGGQSFSITQQGFPCDITIGSNSTNIVASGGSGSFTVMKSPGSCEFTAVANDLWILVTNSSASPVQFTVAANPTVNPRTGTITVGGQTHTVTQAGATCSYAINPAGANFSAAGGNGSFNMSTTPSTGCAFTATTSDGWISITNASSTPVTFMVAANPTASQRTGTISAGGKTYTVTQAAATCNYMLGATSANLASAGGGGSFTVTTIPGTGCPFTATTGESWIELTNASSSPVTFTVGANPTVNPRTGTIIVGGLSYTVTQAGATCAFMLGASSSSIGGAGGSGSFTVTTAPATGCAFTASTGDAWITITNSSLSPVTFTVATNPSVAPRVGTITVGGQTHTVNQAGAVCNYQLNPVSSNFSATGGASSFNVTTSPATGCAFTATSGDGWITITNASSSPVAFTVAANPAATARTGTITVGGQTHTINQAGAPCAFTLGSASSTLAGAGGSGSFTVTSVPATGCGFTAATGEAWITITNASSSPVTFTVAANPTLAPRTGTITVGGQSHTVQQAAGSCAFTLGSASSNLAGAGGSGSFTVTTMPATGCAFTASTSDAWITINNSSLSPVTFTVAPNPAVTPRTGTITVGGQTHTVNQAGAACAYTLGATASAVGIAGGTGSFTVTSAPAVGCGFTATTGDAWITITNASSSPVSYSVGANPTGNPRSGAITVGGQIHFVNQAGTCAAITLASPQSPIAAGASSNTSSVAASPAGNYKYTLANGTSLPAGLLLNQTTGAITGAPAAAGDFSFDIKAEQLNGANAPTGCFVIQTRTILVVKYDGALSDPIVCLGPGDPVEGVVELSNPSPVAQSFTLATSFANMSGLAGTCVLTGAATGATCSVTAEGLQASGAIPARTTLVVRYRARIRDAAEGVTVTATSVATLNGATVQPNPLVYSQTVNCPAAGPGAAFPSASETSDQKAGSVLFFNVFTSSAINSNTQNTRINLTNTHATRAVNVHLFFVDGSTCAVADSYLCLTPNQTSSFMASDVDPGTTGYVVAVAVGSEGCPINFNYLIGDAYVKFTSGHAANLGAESIAALPTATASCTLNATSATLAFDGVNYNTVPRMLALGGIASAADGNDMLLIVNRVGGNLTTGAATLTGLFGVLYDDVENAASFSVNPSACQLRGNLSNNFPRTTPRFETVIQAGRSGWMRLYPQTEQGIFGAAINFNANARAQTSAYNQGHNLHRLTSTAAMVYTIPVFPPSC